MYELSRFLKAQERDYDTTLSEIRSGHKRSHFIFVLISLWIECFTGTGLLFRVCM